MEDEGCGIPEAERERVFEPFYRGPRERADGIPGAGLGLAIAREIARGYGGEVTAEAPAARKGARFRIVLPRAAA